MAEQVLPITDIFPQAQNIQEATVTPEQLNLPGQPRLELGWGGNTEFKVGIVEEPNRTLVILAAPTVRGSHFTALLSGITQHAGDQLNTAGMVADWEMPKTAGKYQNRTYNIPDEVRLLRVHRQDPSIPFMDFVARYLKPWNKEARDARFHLADVIAATHFIEIESFTRDYIQGLREDRGLRRDGGEFTYFLQRFLNTHSYKFTQFALKHPEVFPFKFDLTSEGFYRAESDYFGHTKLDSKKDKRWPQLVAIFDRFIEEFSPEEQQELVMDELTTRDWEVFVDPIKGKRWQREYYYNSQEPLFPDRRPYSYQSRQEEGQIIVTASNAYGSSAEVYLLPQRGGLYTVNNIIYHENTDNIELESGIIPVVVWEETRVKRGPRSVTHKRFLSEDEVKQALGPMRRNADLLAGKAVIATYQPGRRRHIPKERALVNPITREKSRPQEIDAAQVGVMLMMPEITHIMEEDPDSTLTAIRHQTRRSSRLF